MTKEQEQQVEGANKKERVLFAFSIADTPFSIVEQEDKIVLKSQDPTISLMPLDICPPGSWNTSTSQSPFDERGRTGVGFILLTTVNDQVRFRATNHFGTEYWYYGSMSDDWNIRHDLWVNSEYVVSYDKEKGISVEEFPDENARLIRKLNIMEIELERNQTRRKELYDASFNPEFAVDLERKAERENAHLVGFKQLSFAEILKRMSERNFLLGDIEDWQRVRGLLTTLHGRSPHGRYGKPRLEIPEIGRLDALIARLWGDYLWGDDEEYAVYVLKDFYEDTSYVLDYDTECYLIPSSALWRLTKAARDSDDKRASISTDGLHLVHRERFDDWSGYHAGEPEQTSEANFLLSLDLETRFPSMLFSVEMLPMDKTKDTQP